jgi:hypothetical protein
MLKLGFFSILIFQPSFFYPMIQRTYCMTSKAQQALTNFQQTRKGKEQIKREIFEEFENERKNPLNSLTKFNFCRLLQKCALDDSYASFARSILDYCPSATTICNVAQTDNGLHHAVMYDSVVMVYLLLKYGSNPNFKGSFGETPLSLCCQNFWPYKYWNSERLRKRKRMLELLLRKGADPNIKTDSSRVTPLMILLDKKNCMPLAYRKKFISYLLFYGASTKTENSNKENCLKIANLSKFYGLEVLLWNAKKNLIKNMTQYLYSSFLVKRKYDPTFYLPRELCNLIAEFVYCNT